MLAHQWYDANFDDELKEDRLQAKRVMLLNITTHAQVMLKTQRNNGEIIWL